MNSKEEPKASELEGGGASSSSRICCICTEIVSPDFPDLCQGSDVESASMCIDCVQGYIQSKISSGFHGHCASIKCPVSHAKGKAHLLPYNEWIKFLPEESVTMYNKHASSVLEILCGNCHRQKTVLVPIDQESSSTFKATLGDIMNSTLETNTTTDTKTIEDLLQKIHSFAYGNITADELYEICVGCFPTLNSGDDKCAWDIMLKILSFIEDPERRGALQLRHFRSRPVMKSSCCGHSHCWNCKTKTHKGISCEENAGKMDHSVVPCPSCGVSLAKGDGCNSVTCFCGNSFDWSSQKSKVNGSKAFTEAYPRDTTYHCVKILTESQEQSQISLSMAYKAMNVIDVNQGLFKWWLDSYPECPAQKAAVPDKEISMFQGRKDALKLYKEKNPKGVRHCEAEHQAVLSNFFTSLYPNATEQAHMAMLFTTSRQQVGAPMLGRVFEKSVRKWCNDNQALLRNCEVEFNQRSAMRALYLFGNTPTENLILGTSIAESGGSAGFGRDGLSNDSLNYSSDNRTCTRPGGVSCYPAAFVPLSSPNCRISFEITSCALSVNYMSFGLCKKNMGNSSSDGFGRTSNTWGVCDNRNTSNREDMAFVGSNRESCGSMRKFQEGDIITLNFNVHQETFSFVLNHGEFEQEWNVDCSGLDDPQNAFMFGCTFANDHSVSIIDDGVVDEPNGTINREQMVMLQRAVRCMNHFQTKSGSSASSSSRNDDDDVENNTQLQVLPEYFRNLAEDYERTCGFENKKETILNLYMHVEGAFGGRTPSLFSVREKVLVPFNLTLKDYCGLICWSRVNEDFVNATIHDRLALEHMETFQDSAAFMAANICFAASSKSGPDTRDVKSAKAYMNIFSDSVHEWYDYNDTLSDPIIPKSTERCRCLPRHTKRCPNPTPKPIVKKVLKPLLSEYPSYDSALDLGGSLEMLFIERDTDAEEEPGTAPFYTGPPVTPFTLDELVGIGEELPDLPASPAEQRTGGGGDNSVSNSGGGGRVGLLESIREPKQLKKVRRVPSVIGLVEGAMNLRSMVESQLSEEAKAATSVSAVPVSKAKTCTNYKRFGFCAYGNRCRYNHGVVVGMGITTTSNLVTNHTTSEGEKAERATVTTRNNNDENNVNAKEKI